jgi:hypothetical protein
MYPVPAKVYSCQIAISISILEVIRYYVYRDKIEAFGRIVRWWF